MANPGKSRAAARSTERPPPAENEEQGEHNTPPSPPPANRLHAGRESPPHIHSHSRARSLDLDLDEPEPLHARRPPDSFSVNQSSLERILGQQQQQLSLALAEQQRTMMSSFQTMMADVLHSHATPTPRTTTTTNATTSQSKMRLSDPDPFDGSPKNAESFLDSCVNIFMVQPQLYANADAQVCFALSFCKSNAVRWRDGMFRRIRNGEYIITDWEDFEDRFRETFGNPHHVQEAQ